MQIKRVEPHELNRRIVEIVAYLCALAFGLLLAACSSGRAASLQPVGFDRRYQFKVFTSLPVEQAFPFEAGQQIRMAVYLMPNPMQDWVRQELSAEAEQLVSIYPAGPPDPNDSYLETILAEFAPAGRPDQQVILPWRVDNDDVLLAVVAAGQVSMRLRQAQVGDMLPAAVLMEVSRLEQLEADLQGASQLWLMELTPVGEVGEKLINGQVDFTLP